MQTDGYVRNRIQRSCPVAPLANRAPASYRLVAPANSEPVSIHRLSNTPAATMRSQRTEFAIPATAKADPPEKPCSWQPVRKDRSGTPTFRPQQSGVRQGKDGGPRRSFSPEWDGVPALC